MQDKDTETLIEFLEMPINSSDAVFDKFADLPNAILRGISPNRFLYIKGTRENKVLLVAHADTVWDSKATRRECVNKLEINDNVISSANPASGIGCDDRGGCAMLWLLKDSGHSLLITDGEEQGMLGSYFLMHENKDIASEINSIHQFMIQIDRCNSTDFKCYDVGTDEFRKYVEERTNYTEPDRDSCTDIKTLCKNICGVNLSTGYYEEHTASEYININEWQNTLNLLRDWLKEETLPKFKR